MALKIQFGVPADDNTPAPDPVFTHGGSGKGTVRVGAGAENHIANAAEPFNQQIRDLQREQQHYARRLARLLDENGNVLAGKERDADVLRTKIEGLNLTLEGAYVMGQKAVAKAEAEGDPRVASLRREERAQAEYRASRAAADERRAHGLPTTGLKVK